MATNFGVQLKKSGDGCPEKKGPSTTPGGARRSDFKTKPVSDLKAMFAAKDQEAKHSSDILTKNTTTTSVSSGQRSNVTKTVKTEVKSTGPNSKLSSTSTTTKFSKEIGGTGLSEADKNAFEALRNKMKTTGFDELTSNSKEPILAVAKTYSGGNTYKATVDSKKVQRAGDESNVPVTKTAAASILSFGLTKLRTRPESLKGDEDTNITNSASTTTGATSTHKPSSPISKDFSKEKYIPGAAKGWKGSGDEGAERSSKELQKPALFNDSSVGKVRSEVKAEKDTKVKGFRSVSPVNFNRNSSDDSSGSSNLSPRGYKVNSEYTVSKKESDESKTDINKNIKKFQTAKADTNVFKTKQDNRKPVKVELRKTNSATCISDTKTSLLKTESKPKMSAVEQLALDKDRLRNNRNSGGSFSSDSEKGKRSPKVKGEFKWMDKSRISLEEFKQQVKEESHKPLSRASSSGSNSSVTRREATNVKSRIQRFASPDSDKGTQSRAELSPAKNVLSPTDNTGLRKRDMGVSKKINPDRFKDIKKGFETRNFETRTPSPSHDKKPQIKIKTEKKLLERKQSFEDGAVYRRSYERKEIVSPRDKGSVLQTVKALAELDARAKAKPVIVRRAKSLPSDSLDDDNDSLVDYYDDTGQEEYYQEIQGMRIGDDVSNEGDISSEADLIYEEIPANMALEDKDSKTNFKDMKDRRATAFRKRRKASEEQVKPPDAQTGTEGDVDSDSDSSNSGIYEYVDNDNGQEARLSESDGAPELPAPRTQNLVKKKKKKETKGEKGEKEKKGLKGKLKQQSTGVLNKLKNFKKSKSSSSGTNLEAMNIEDNPVCDSAGTDTDVDIDPSSQRSSRSDDASPENQSAPPLPPRHSAGDLTKLNNEKDNTSRLSANSDNLNNRPNSGTYENNPSVKKSPPLPPRNRISNNLDINVVVPVNPGGEMRKSGWPPAKDSYLHMQKIPNTGPTSPDLPYIDDISLSPKSPKPLSSTDAPPLPNRPIPLTKQREKSSTSTYIDVDKTPPVPRRPMSKQPLQQKDSYVDVGDAPVPDDDYSLADEIRKELEKRPISSAYIGAHDLSTVPEPRTMKAPFEDVLKFCSQYDEDGLYMDLSDDQVYGTAGRYKSKFESEALYQFYNKDKIHRASRRKAIYSSFDESDEEDDDSSLDKESIYEDLSEYSSGRGSLDMDRKVDEVTSGESGGGKKTISTLEMFGKKGTVMRSLWAEMPEVKTSGYLDTITPHERKLQESMFEIITSEATYLKSLNVLMDTFLCSDEFGSDMSNKCVITKQERHVIFSNIGAIRDASERFLTGLEERWQKSVLLSDICDIISDQASKYFECYVHYCSNQAFQDRAVTDLRRKQDFAEALKRLESSQDCQGLPMISFLLLPMQRITRLPLLVDAICHRLDPQKDKDRHKSATNACNALSKVVKKCNDGAKKMQQTEQMYHIAKQIAFSPTKEIAQIPLISASRYLVKQGEVTRIASEAGTRLPFGKNKPGKLSQHMYLFNDILLITKKKGDKYIVVDYGQRNTLHVETIDSVEKNPRVLPNGVPSGCKNLFLLVILENHEKKQVEMVFACNSTSDRARWVDAVTPVRFTDDQKIYEEWDCPQVQCIKKYVAEEPDELSLEESDVVNVFKKLDDGMYEGERLRDGERGWFPKDHTVEIVNSHVRARNLRMKYRMMAAVDYMS